MRPIKLIMTIDKGMIYEMEPSLWQFMPSTTYYWAHVDVPGTVHGPYKSVEAAQKAYELDTVLQANKVVEVDFVLRKRIT